ncbi:ankyrin repeat domain-containing protein [Iodobacter sp. LRB]|uniref:ankyrin repeat domain-containing protein n=1 Tax=unclassified Iodobacter TaxID=235634 RepID=UPI0015D4DC38|nr:ankyrin repeat domain-containing protein [Iodobacter sp. BJB302]
MNAQFLIDQLRKNISPEHFPIQLETRYPSVLAQIMKCWELDQLDACFNDLLLQGQQKQDEFPGEIVLEIFRLQVALDAVPKKTLELWGDIPEAKVNPEAKADPLSKAALQAQVRRDAQVILAQYGFSVNSKGLHQAIEQRHYNLLPQFVRAGMPVEQTDDAGWTPVMHACFAGRLDIVVELIELNANLLVTDCYGYTLLHWAALNGNADLVTLLMTYDLNPQQTSNKGITPLMQAAAGDHVAVMKLLVAKCGMLAVHAQCQEGWTALHKAAVNKKVSAALWLAEHGADPYLRNQRGESACSLALELNQHRLYDLLSEWADRHAASK